MNGIIQKCLNSEEKKPVKEFLILLVLYCIHVFKGIPFSIQFVNLSKYAAYTGFVDISNLYQQKGI